MKYRNIAKNIAEQALAKYIEKALSEQIELVEEVEQLDEIGNTPDGKKRLVQYTRDAVIDLHGLGHEKGYTVAMRRFGHPPGDADYLKYNRNTAKNTGIFKSQSIARQAVKRNTGINRAVARLAREEAEQIDEAKAKMTDAHKKAAKEVHRELKSDDQQVSQVHGDRIRNTHSLLRRKYGSNWRALAGINEEVEQVDEE